MDRNRHCILNKFENEINIENYTESNASVSTDPKIFKEALEKCKTKKKDETNIYGLLSLNGGQGNSDQNHANSLIISTKEKKIWRVEPNFSVDWLSESIVKQFNTDGLKLGIYKNIDYKDIINQKLYEWVKKLNIGYTFDGYYRENLKSCPNHGGLCSVLSALQLYLPKQITPENIKYYLIKFFEYKFKELYKQQFFENLDIYTLLISIVREYIVEINKLTNEIPEVKINDTIIDIKELDDINKIKSLIGNEDMKKIIIKIGKYDVISLERPDGRYLTPISDLDYKINQGQYRSIFSFGKSKSKSKSKIKETRLNKIHKDIIFLKKLNLN